MYHVYVLKGQTNPPYYIGFTANLRRRIDSHNVGVNRATSDGIPWKLIYCESYIAEEDARIREKRLKSYGRTWQELKRRIGEAPQTMRKGAG